MTVKELYDLLEEFVLFGKGDYEVRVAYQPNYPLQSSVLGVALSDDVEDALDGAEAETGLGLEDLEVLWIVEDESTNAHARKAIWRPRAITN